MENGIRLFCRSVLIGLFAVIFAWCSSLYAQHSSSCRRKAPPARSHQRVSKKVLQASTQFFQANKLSLQGKHLLAAKMFLNAANTYPTWKDAPLALWNAAVLFEKVSHGNSALRLYLRITRQYPRWIYSSLAGSEQAIFRAANYYNRTLQWYEAERWYAKLLRWYRRSSRRSDYALELAYLQERRGLYKKAAASFLRFSRLLPGSAFAPKVLLEAAKCLQSARNSKKAEKIYIRIIKRFKRGQVGTLVALKAHMELTKLKEMSFRRMTPRQRKRAWPKIKRSYLQSQQMLQKGLQKLSPMEKALAGQFPARALYKVKMHEVYKPFVKMKVNSLHPKRQVRQVKAKLVALKKLENGFKKILRYRSPVWSLCALYRIAEGHARTAQTFLNAPIPKVKGLRWNKDSIDLYNRMFEEKLVIPFENKAKVWLRKAWGIAQKGLTHTPCGLLTLKLLGKLLPSTFLPEQRPFLLYSQRGLELPLALHPLPNKRSIKALYQKGLRFARQGKSKEAKAIFRKILQLHPDNRGALLNIGIFWFKEKKFKLARYAWTLAGRGAKARPEAHYYLGILHFVSRSSLPAMKALQRALRMRPGFSEAHHLMGILWSRRGQFQKGLRHFQKALQHHKGYRLALHNMGVAYVHLSQFVKAEKHFLKVLKKSPHHVEAHYQLGILYLRRHLKTKTIPSHLLGLYNQLQKKRSYAQTLKKLSQCHNAMTHFNVYLKRGKHPRLLTLTQKYLKKAVKQCQRQLKRIHLKLKREERRSQRMNQ